MISMKKSSIKNNKLSNKNDKLIFNKKNKLRTTLDWLSIREIKNDEIIIQDKDDYYYIRGLVIEPKNIWLMDKQDRDDVIDSLANCFNNISFNVYFKSIFIEPNLRNQNQRLLKQIEDTEDKNIKYIGELFLEAHEYFLENFQELQFLLLVVEKEKYIDHVFDELTKSLNYSELIYHKMNYFDYQNLVVYEFQNNNINELFFNKLLNPEIENYKGGEIDD